MTIESRQATFTARGACAPSRQSFQPPRADAIDYTEGHDSAALGDAWRADDYFAAAPTHTYN